MGDQKKNKPATEKTGASGAKRKRGRPPGKSQKVAGVSEAKPSRCPRCGSTRRAPYWGKIERDCRVSIGGIEYTHVVLRTTRCRDCGAIRRDRQFENRPTPLADQVREKSGKNATPEAPNEPKPKGGRRRQLGVAKGLVG